jgi:hypothetical protein
MPEGFLLQKENWKQLSPEWQRALNGGQANTFAVSPEKGDRHLSA